MRSTAVASGLQRALSTDEIAVAVSRARDAARSALRHLGSNPPGILKGDTHAGAAWRECERVRIEIERPVLTIEAAGEGGVDRDLLLRAHELLEDAKVIADSCGEAPGFRAARIPIREALKALRRARA